MRSLNRNPLMLPLLTLLSSLLVAPLAKSLHSELVSSVLFVIIGASLVELIIRFSSASERGWRNQLRTLFLMALGLRLSFMIAFHLGLIASTGQPFISGGDAQGYYRDGVSMATMIESFTWSFDYIKSTVDGAFHWGYQLTSGFVYAALGHHVILMKLFNVFLGASLPLLILQLARPFFDEKIARAGAYLTAIYPTLILWSSVNLKESVYAFLVLAAVLFAMRFARTLRLRDALSCLLVFGMATTVRGNLTYFLIVSTFAYWGLVIMPRFGARGVARVAVGLVVLGVLATTVMPSNAAGWLLRFADLDVVNVVLEKSISQQQKQNIDIYGVSPSTKRELIAALPLASARLILSPLPWKVDGRHVVTAAGTLMNYILYPFVAWGIIMTIRMGWRRHLLIYLVPLLVMGGVTVYALGGGIRWQTPAFPFLMLLAAVGAYYARSVTLRLSLLSISLVMIIGVYSLMLWEATGWGWALVSVLTWLAIVTAVLMPVWRQRRRATRCVANE